MNAKDIKDSMVVMANVMLPQQANPAGNVHGGEVMKLMDTAAGTAARRHARTNVVTARVDELRFLYPMHIGDVVTCYAKLTFVGKSSMEVLVTVTVEDLSREEPPKTALTAFFTFVSLDSKGKPQPVPALNIYTDDERKAYDEGYKRYLLHKKMR